MPSYWSSMLQQRTSRRHALAAAGVTAAGAAFLAACGGGGSKTGSGDKSGLVASMVDETKAIKRGGNFAAGIRGGGYVHMDPHSAVIQPYGYFYSNLVKMKLGYMDSPDGVIEGDLFESWELSPDKLQLTGKINPKAQFAPVAPVNGRMLDAGDITASWQRFSQIGSYRNELVNAVEPTAPILSLTSTDDRTIVIKIKEPFAPIFSMLAASRSGNFNIIPREALDQKVLDIRTTPVGSGPWMIKEWRPSSDIIYTRNPNYKHDKLGEVPYLDTYQGFFITETAVHTAQLKAGNIFYSQFFPKEEVLRTKTAQPELSMYPTKLNPDSSNSIGIIFGKLPDSPFKDDRVRKAAYMSYDHEIINDTLANSAEYKNAGLPVDSFLENSLPAFMPGDWFLNPEGKDFGPNAKYFKENLPEAKKLLAAAGFANGVDTVLHYPPGYNPNIIRKIETFLGEFGRTGLIRYKIDLVDYNVEWTPKYRLIRGQIPDLALINATSASEDPTLHLLQKYHSSGAAYFHGNDAKDEELLNKAVREFDDAKRKALLHEVQRNEAAMLHFPLGAGTAGAYEVLWPAVRNWGIYQGERENFRTVWLDRTKPPFSKT